MLRACGKCSNTGSMLTVVGLLMKRYSCVYDLTQLWRISYIKTIKDYINLMSLYDYRKLTYLDRRENKSGTILKV